MNHQKTAILIFANSALEEGNSKPFRRSVPLFEELNRQTLQKVKKSGLPYFLFSEKEQNGNTFGERYTNAIQFVYDQGYENVITIGNDTPHLQTNQLWETVEKLKENPIVLGPSADGGYYLMGLHKSQFNKELFLNIPWQTSRVTQTISRLLSARNIKVVFLKVLTDIDSVSDIKTVLNSFKQLSATLKNIISSIISSEKKLILNNVLATSSFLKTTYFNKGSPVLLHFY